MSDKKKIPTKLSLILRDKKPELYSSSAERPPSYSSPDDSHDRSDFLGGTNFLISTIFHLRRQKKDLQRELFSLREQIHLLEKQNADFLNLSADRLMKTLG